MAIVLATSVLRAGSRTEFADTAFTVPNSSTQLCVIPCNYIQILACEIAVATQNITGFIIQGRMHSAGSYQTLYSTTSDFTNVQGILKGTSGDLTTITAGASGWFILDVAGMESITLYATCAASSGTVNVRAGEHVYG